MAKADLIFRSAVLEAPEATTGVMRLSFASELPVLRRDSKGKYWEVLSHAPGDANLGLLNRAGMVLQDHDERIEIGDVVKGSAKVDADKKTRADIKIFDEPWNTRAKTDFKTIPISVGYNRLTELRSLPADAQGIPTRVYSWRPYEISLLTVEAADSTVGIGRGIDSEENVNVEQIAQNLTPEEKNRMRILLDPNPAAGGGGAAVLDEKQLREKFAADFKTRKKEIIATVAELAKVRPDQREKLDEMANDAIGLDSTLKEFRLACLEHLQITKPNRQITMESIGVSEKEKAEYSVGRAIRCCLEKEVTVPDALEGEVHRALEKQISGDCKLSGGFVVPFDAVLRGRYSKAQRNSRANEMQVGIFGQGGALVATELRPNVIELFRNKMVTDALGVQTMGGLRGNVSFPRQVAASTAYSVGEIAALTKSNPVLDQISVNPKRVGIFGEYSRQLLLQDVVDVESFLNNDQLLQLALKWDYLTMFGSGAASEPLGIFNTPGIGSVTFGGAATFTKVVSFETALAVLNADMGNMGYVTTPAARGTLKSAAKLLVGATTVAAVPIWDKDEMNGYKSMATNQIINNLMGFGNWADAIRCLWGGIEIVLNPYSRDTEGLVRLTMNTFGDMCVRHAPSFCASSDSANQ